MRAVDTRLTEIARGLWPGSYVDCETGSGGETDFVLNGMDDLSPVVLGNTQAAAELRLFRIVRRVRWLPPRTRGHSESVST